MSEEPMKVCLSKRRLSCGQIKPLSAFVKTAKRLDGHDSICSECRSQSRRESHSVVATRAANLRRMYGITLEEYETLRAAQSYRCALCRRHEDELPSVRGGRPCKDGTAAAENPKLVVDHDHENGLVRGLVCATCNTALGALGDNVAGLMRAVNYLRRASTPAADCVVAAAAVACVCVH